jgi:hypothetical protein
MIRVKKYLASLVCGFGAGVMQIVPFIKSFSCCFILPLAVFMALVLDQRATNYFGKITIKKGLIFGLFTGLFAALFGSIFEILITFLTKQNDIIVGFPELERMVQSFPVTLEIKQQVVNMFQNVKNDLLNYGFSWFYTISIIANNFIVNSVFGMVGGLIGVQIINNKYKNQSDL